MKAVPIDLSAGAVVAITGGGRGIGRATALAFAEEGARVAIGDLDSETALATAAELSSAAGQVRGYALDVASRKSFAAFIDAAEADLGPVDVLINNAGVMPSGSFLEETDETSDLSLDVNLRGPILGMKLVLPGMIGRGRGHVVNVASMAGRFAVPGLAVYVASKHGVIGLTASVREELKGTGVTITAVLPTAVKTELASGFPLAGTFPVEAGDVAAAILGSLVKRPGEIAVPRIVGLIPAAETLLPGPAMNLARRALRQNRTITAMDPVARADYLERLERQTGARTTERQDPAE